MLEASIHTALDTPDPITEEIARDRFQCLSNTVGFLQTNGGSGQGQALAGLAILIEVIADISLDQVIHQSIL